MIHRSPFADVAIPDMHLTDLVLRHADRLAGRAAVRDLGGRGYTYGEVARHARRLAAGLARDGIQKGDVVALLTPNIPEYPIVFHGVALAGAATTTLNPVYTVEEIASQLRDSHARILITVPALREKAAEAAAASGVPRIVVIGGEAPDDLESLYGEAETTAVAVNPATDTVVLPYSSGTTGFSKGVVLTHRNLVANLVQLEPAHHLGEDEVIISFLPFFHIYGMQVLMNSTLYHGATLLTMERFDLAQFLTAIQEHRPQRLYIVPPVALGLAKHPLVSEFDLSSVRVVFSGAAPLDGDTAQALAARIGCKVIQGYGLTETSPVTHSVPDNAGDVNPASIGPALPNTEVKVVDIDTGEELGLDQDGEIWIRGPQVMRGYLNNEAATRACIDEDGFFHTGDIGHVDARGDFVIVDRLKELIKVKGLQVAPAELESVLIAHPKITDAAVIGVADAEAGERPKAFVVRADEELDADAVKAWVAERLAHYKKLGHVEFVDTIPKSASGKILRRLLRDREAASV